VTFETVLALSAMALVAGALIGSIGIGGVVVPPALVFALGFDPHIAAGTSSWSFLFTGVAGSLIYIRRGFMPWRMVILLTGGIVPAAVFGATLNSSIPDALAMVPLAILALAAGGYQLFSPRRRGATDRRIPAAGLVCVGAVVGLASAATGTGGPFILVPILLFLGVPVVTAVAAAQVIQVPLVIFASAGYALHGDVDFAAGTLLGIVAIVGVYLGSRVATRAPANRIRLFAGLSLFVIGVALLIVNGIDLFAG